jgi:hypothetical protein
MRVDMMKVLPHPSDDPAIVAEALRRFGPGPSDDPEIIEMGFWSGACAWMIATENEWKRKGDVFAWVDPTPEWVPSSAWRWQAGVLNPDEPCGGSIFAPLASARR